MNGNITVNGSQQETLWSRLTQQSSHFREKALQAEEKMLNSISIPCQVQDTHIGPHPQNYIHSIAAGESSKPILVCLPGYCAGAAMYFKNLVYFTQKYRTFLVDWPGQGLSGRPPFTPKNTQQSIDFFVYALQKWSKLNGVGKMTLLGHSMGGYIAAQYALRNPSQIDKLVFACAAGIADKSQEKGGQIPTLPPFWSTRGQFYRVIGGAWELGVTPGVILRSFGPFGLRTINNYTNTRFRDSFGWSQDESDMMRDYIYYTVGQKGCAEFVLRHLMGPFVWAREPMEDKLLELQVPFGFVYAKNDFIRPDVAWRVNGKLQGKYNVKVEIVEDAGHLVYMQRPNEFVEKVLKVCQ